MLHTFDRELELSDRLETDYLRVLYYDFSQKYADSYHSYEYARLCTILEGEKLVSINNAEEVKYAEDEFLLMPPNSDVHMTIAKSTKALVFDLSDTLIKKVSERISENYRINYKLLIKEQPFCTRKSMDLKDVLCRINRLLTAGNGNTEYVLDLYAQELAYHLIQIKGVRQILDFETDNPVNKAIQYMKNEYMMPIKIKEISAGLNMSEANFCQYFKKVTGVTPKDYLTNIRMEKAKGLLARVSVTETALELGYENISYFISLFKEKYGITPKQYRKMMV